MPEDELPAETPPEFWATELVEAFPPGPGRTIERTVVAGDDAPPALAELFAFEPKGAIGCLGATVETEDDGVELASGAADVSSPLASWSIWGALMFDAWGASDLD